MGSGCESTGVNLDHGENPDVVVSPPQNAKESKGIKPRTEARPERVVHPEGGETWGEGGDRQGGGYGGGGEGAGGIVGDGTCPRWELLGQRGRGAREKRKHRHHRHTTHQSLPGSGTLREVGVKEALMFGGGVRGRGGLRPLEMRTMEGEPANTEQAKMGESQPIPLSPNIPTKKGRIEPSKKGERPTHPPQSRGTAPSRGVAGPRGRLEGVEAPPELTVLPAGAFLGNSPKGSPSPSVFVT